MKLRNDVRRRVREDALGRLVTNRTEKSANAHLYTEVLEPGEKLQELGQEIEVEEPSALVMVDLMPDRNWAHPCEWHLYGADNGVRRRAVKAHFPPHLMVREHAKFEAVNAPVAPIDTATSRPRARPQKPTLNVLINHPGDRYAVLYSGASNNRHVNDLEFLYRTLVDVYGFAPDHIFVLNHDGSVNYNGGPKPVLTWPGDATAYRMPVDGQGTRAGMQAVLGTVAGRIRKGDLLFIHTNNHGAGPGDGVADFCMCAYSPGDWTPYFVNDFVADLATLPAFDVLMVMMEQCRSGGFIAPVIAGSPAAWTHMCTAVAPPDYSLGGANFDPFAEDWIAGITGHYPDGTGLLQAADATGDGRISAAEAFAYADAVHHPGDTPTVSDSPAGYGQYVFLGQPAHDLFLRDNLTDHGIEPLVGGGISLSPDIVVYNEELLDPAATLLDPAVRDVDTLGEPVEVGQDNDVYVRVQNRGSEPTGGTAKVFWSPPSTLPTPASWHLIGEAPIPAVDPGEMAVAGPIVWKEADIPPIGHYCFVGLVDSGDDPAPDPAAIATIDDYYRFIRESNNATWKNFNVRDVFPNSLTNLAFHIQGWQRKALTADLAVDLTPLPKAATVKLRILRRLGEEAALKNASVVEETALWRRYLLRSGTVASLSGIHLQPSEETEAALEVVLPDGIEDGAYRISVAQFVDGKEMGRVTMLLGVGDHPYLANTRSHELHVPSCSWARKVSAKHRLAFSDVDRALKHGYNGCRYCLPEYDTDLVKA